MGVRADPRRAVVTAAAPVRLSLMLSVTVLSLALLGCQAASRPARPDVALDPSQQEELVAAEALYRERDPAFAEVRDRLAAEPRTAWWLTRLMLYDLVRSVDAVEATDNTFLGAVATGQANPLAGEPLEHLQQIGAAAVPAIVDDMLRSPYADRRRLGADVLVQLGPDSIAPLVPLLGDPEDKVRREVVRVAGAVVAPAATALLEQAVQDRAFVVRAAAFAGLAARGAPQADRLRRGLAEEADPYVRRVIARGLGALADRPTAAALIDYYADALDRQDYEGVRVADGSLRRISGVATARDLAFWRAWLASWPGPQER
ncbi:MAG: HEAT repeat domain-containing protein [Planctomycetota bacterium]